MDKPCGCGPNDECNKCSNPKIRVKLNKEQLDKIRGVMGKMKSESSVMTYIDDNVEIVTEEAKPITRVGK
jgi:hypothetical protein